MSVVVRMGIVGVSRVSRFVNRRTLLEFDLAFTTVATTGATLAEVIGTGVFGAGGANFRGFLSADTTVKCHN